MNIMGWTIGGKAETRQANYTDAMTQALQSILEQKPARADALAVVESCVSLIADPLLVATTIGLPLPSRMLYQAARDVPARGQQRLGNRHVNGSATASPGAQVGHPGTLSQPGYLGIRVGNQCPQRHDQGDLHSTKGCSPTACIATGRGLDRASALADSRHIGASYGRD